MNSLLMASIQGNSPTQTSSLLSSVLFCKQMEVLFVLEATLVALPVEGAFHKHILLTGKLTQ